MTCKTNMAQHSLGSRSSHLFHSTKLKWASSILLALLFVTISLSGTTLALPDESTAKMDSDSDGVPDSVDLCPGTIPGATGVDITGCPIKIDPFADLTFDHKKHRAWYRRFWTGSCKGLGFWDFCSEGRPGSSSAKRSYWFNTVDKCVRKVEISQRGPLRFRLWKLGRLVGHEWARDNDIRKIDTRDIRRWGNQILECSTFAEFERVISNINEVAKSRLRKD